MKTCASLPMLSKPFANSAHPDVILLVIYMNYKKVHNNQNATIILQSYAIIKYSNTECSVK